MSVTLILRRNMDPTDPDYVSIQMDEWLSLIDADPSLSIRTEDHVARHPRTGQEMMRMRARLGECDLDVNGQKVPLLRYHEGTLHTEHRDSMDDPTDPARLKLVEIARTLNAHIAHDAGDDILDW